MKKFAVTLAVVAGLLFAGVCLLVSPVVIEAIKHEMSDPLDDPVLKKANRDRLERSEEYRRRQGL